MNENTLKNSTLLRMVLVGALCIVLLIPWVMVSSLITERENRRNDTVQSISAQWGGKQTLTGPILSIPYKKTIRNSEGKEVTTTHFLHLFPDTLAVAATLEPLIRYRGIYETILYNSRTTVSGQFSLLQLAGLSIVPQDIDWQHAFLTVGISDTKGLQETPHLQWEGTTSKPMPGINPDILLSSGFTYPVSLWQEATSYSFKLQCTLHGNTEFCIAPVGENNTITLSSTWSDPSFIGNILPVKREVRTNGFTAQWDLVGAGRTTPPDRDKKIQVLADNSIGVRLMIPVDQYRQTERTIKYAIIFIVLTFVAFFLTEIIAKIILHPIHYSLIGLALILFYVLLLSLSEHISFVASYLTASTGIIGLITLYTGWITRNRKIAVMISSLLSMLYLYLYVILQLEDYALLIGSLGLFGILACVMYLTRNVDWFNLKGAEQE